VASCRASISANIWFSHFWFVGPSGIDSCVDLLHEGKQTEAHAIDVQHVIITQIWMAAKIVETGNGVAKSTTKQVGMLSYTDHPQLSQ